MRRLGLGLRLINGGAPGVRDPFSAFTAGVDFAAGTAFGGTQPYGNNTDDGRLFRDPTNTLASIIPNADGSFASIGSAGIRRTTLGAFNYPSATVRNLWGTDLTNAAWTKTNITAAKDQPDLLGNANTFTSLLATAANGTCLQAITLASNTFVYQVDIKRLIGTGPVFMTIDGGTTWTDITAQISGGASYSLAFITQAAVTNPMIGFKIQTSGDKIAVGHNMIFTPPVVGMNIPRYERVSTTSATQLNSQSRPNAAITDAPPNTLINIARGYFGFYHECTSRRPTGGFLMTGSTGVFSSVDATNAGAVKFSVNTGASATAAGVWKSDGVGINKVAGYFASDGSVKVAANGNLGSLGSGGVPEATLDHFDLSTNGAGSNSLYSITRKFYMGAFATFTDDELLAMTA